MQDELGRVAKSFFAVAGMDSVPIETVFANNPTALLPSEPRDWQALYPVSKLMRSVRLPAPPPPAAVFHGEGGRIILVSSVSCNCSCPHES